MPTVISNITFTNQRAAEIFPGVCPTQRDGQLRESIFNCACLRGPVAARARCGTSGRLKDACVVPSVCFPMKVMSRRIGTKGDGSAPLFVGRLLPGDNVSARFQCPTFFDRDQLHLQSCPREAAPSTSQST